MATYESSAPRPIPGRQDGDPQGLNLAGSYPTTAPHQQRVSDIRQDAGVPQYSASPNQIFGTSPQASYFQQQQQQQQPQQRQYSTSPSYPPPQMQQQQPQQPQQRYSTSPSYPPPPQMQQQQPPPQFQYSTSPQQHAGGRRPSMPVMNSWSGPYASSPPPNAYAPPPQDYRPQGENVSWTSQQPPNYGRGNGDPYAPAPYDQQQSYAHMRRHSEAPSSSAHFNHAHRTDYERRSASPSYSDPNDSDYDSEYHDDGCRRHGHEHREHKREHHVRRSRRGSKTKHHHKYEEERRPTLSDSTMWAWDKFKEVLK